MNTAGGSTGSYPGSSSGAHDGGRGQKRDSSIRGKLSKHSGPRNPGNSSGAGWANQNNGGGQRNFGSWRSEASVWLLLINKLLKKSLLPVCGSNFVFKAIFLIYIMFCKMCYLKVQTHYVCVCIYIWSIGVMVGGWGIRIPPLLVHGFEPWRNAKLGMS